MDHENKIDMHNANDRNVSDKNLTQDQENEDVSSQMEVPVDPIIRLWFSSLFSPECVKGRTELSKLPHRSSRQTTSHI